MASAHPPPPSKQRAWILGSLVVLAGLVAWVAQGEGGGSALQPPINDLATNPLEGSAPGVDLETAERTTVTPEAPGKIPVTAMMTWPSWALPPDEATLTLSPQPGTEGETLTRSVSGDSPQTNFGFVPEGNWILSAQADGFQAHRSLHTFQKKRAAVSLLVPFVPAKKIHGRVTNAQGLPAAHCVVTARMVLEDKTRTVIPQTTVCDDLGRFELLGVRPGTYEVHAGPPSAPLGERRMLQLAGEEAWVELAIPPCGSIAVRVEDSEGMTVARAQVTARRWSGPKPGSEGHIESIKTDEHGIAHFHQLPPGEYSFTAHGHGIRQRVLRSLIETGKSHELTLEVRRL